MEDNKKTLDKLHQEINTEIRRITQKGDSFEVEYDRADNINPIF